MPRTAPRPLRPPAAGEHHVRQPQCQAIDQQRAVGTLSAEIIAASASGSSTVCQNAPRRARCAAMRAASRRRRLRGRAIGAAIGGRLDEPLGITALARARAAQHQRHREEAEGALRPVPAAFGPSSSARGIVQIARCGGLLARGRRPRHLPSPAVAWPVVIAAVSPLTVAGAAPVLHRTSLSHRDSDATMHLACRHSRYRSQAKPR